MSFAWVSMSIFVFIGSSLCSISCSSQKESLRSKDTSKNSTSENNSENKNQSSDSTNASRNSDGITAPIPITGGNQKPKKDDKIDDSDYDDKELGPKIECNEESKATNEKPQVLYGCRIIDELGNRISKEKASQLLFGWKQGTLAGAKVVIIQPANDMYFDVIFVFGSNNLAYLELQLKNVHLLVSDTSNSISNYNLRTPLIMAIKGAYSRDQTKYGILKNKISDDLRDSGKTTPPTP